MVKSKLMCVCIVLIVTILFSAASSRGEGFIDLYGGSAHTNTGNAKITGTGVPVSGEVEYKTSITGGIRGGAWLPSFQYLGFAIDGFYFKTNPKDDDDVTQDNFAVAFDIMGRLPLLVSEEIPQGRLQPYVTAGPALFTSILKVPGFSNARETKVGFKVGGGLKFLLMKNVGLFGEYRYTQFESEHEFHGNPALGVVGSAKLSQQLATHHFVGGLSFHF